MRKTRFSRDRGIHHKGWPPEFVAELRDRMLHHFGIAAGPRDLKIYVSRQDAEYRKILNEQEVINYFAGLGYVIITPGFLTLRDQVELFSRAKLIVGCHGAGLTNILWAGIGATLIEFMPNGFDDASYRFLAPLCGCEYHCLICKSDEPEKWDDHKANLEVDMKDLQSLRHLW